MTAVIPELSEACQRRASIAKLREMTETDEREYRALLLAAVAKGATRVEIQASCGMKQSQLESEIKKARAETSDPKLKKVRLDRGGLTAKPSQCPDCDHPPFDSAQANALHRIKMHNYRIGANALTEQMVKKARKDTTTPTRELARRFGVSYHALGAARSRKTWKHLP